MPNPRTPRRRSTAGSALLAALALAASCGPSNDKTSATTSTGVVGGITVEVLVDPNESGQANSVTIEEVTWGRLVDVYDEENRDGLASTREVRTLQRRDFLIGENVTGDGATLRLETNPVTQRQELTIIADADGDYVVPFDTIPQSERYEQRFNDIKDSATVLSPKGVGAAAVPPFPLVPRNAAFSVRFSDLLDPGSITSSTVQLSTGVPPLTKAEARVFADPNHGAFLNGAFFTTRVIVDSTISEFDASGGGLAVNSVGMPAGVSSGVVSGAIRVPTQPAPGVGQFQVLRNLSGSTVRFNNNGPNEPNFTLDVVRGFRAGRRTDANNGFLFDDEPPTIRGVQNVALIGVPTSVPPDDALGEIELGSNPDRVFLTTLDFETDACAQTPRVGDLLVVTGLAFPEIYAEVTLAAAPPQGGVATDVRVRLLRFPADAELSDLSSDFLMANTGRFESSFVPGPGVIGDCFLSISPPPASPPTGDISTLPRISLRFSEAIDPASIRPFDNMRLDRTAGGTSPTDIVVGSVTNTPDLREFRYSPVTRLEFSSSDASTADYFFNVVGGADGITDLAGNPLVEALPPDVMLRIDPTNLDTSTGGVVLRFDTINEFGNLDGDGNPAPEVRGQFLRDLDEGVIMPREVTRLSQVIDPTTAPTYQIGAALGLAAIPETTPLSPFGSRMMTVWRYCDVGFEILDEETANVDVEGLSWSPLSGTVSTDFFSDFQISLSHSVRLPDELPTTGYVFPGPFINSGLQATFNDNVLVDPNNQFKVVHPRERGYQIDPGQQFTSSTGTAMMPYPLNRTGTADNFEYYTWRDTAIIGTGGPDGGGAEVGGHLVTALFGFPGAPCLTAENTPQSGVFATPPVVYPVNGVRSLALPLLMEFKCYSGSGVGSNFPSTVVMGGPTFRAASTGGNTVNGPQLKNPDAEDMATGNSASGTGGTTTIGFLGQLDVVIRVSRVHTRWFDTGAVTGGFPQYGTVVIEPSSAEQPTGTSVSVAFRGATDITAVDPLADLPNANLYDAYGDPLNIVRVDDNLMTCTDPTDDLFDGGAFLTVNADFAPVFPNNDSSWKTNISDLNGVRWIQARITFVSNAATGQRPRLSSLAIPFVRG